MPQSPAPLEVTHASGVNTLRFNRPGALNTIDVPMAQALMRASFDRDLPTQLAAESAAFADCAATHDMRAGMEAFFAKQSAQFEGR